MAHRPAPARTAVAHVPVAIDLVLGTACLAVAYVIVFALRLGGVVATLTADHGIHSGDAAAIPIALLGLAFLTAAFSERAAR
jgi:hypothetical protein